MQLLVLLLVDAAATAAAAAASATWSPRSLSSKRERGQSTTRVSELSLFDFFFYVSRYSRVRRVVVFASFLNFA